MRLHVGAQDGVDTGLVAALLPKPAQQVGIQPHRHNFLRRRHYDTGILPEILIRDLGVGVGCNALGRVAQAFDLAGIYNTVGAPFLRVFCEGAGVGNAGAMWV
jgi:hypothetical protein